MHRNAVRREVLTVAGIASGIVLIVGLVSIPLLSSADTARFASRWNGSGGWSRPLVCWHSVADCTTSAVLTCYAVAMIRRHPSRRTLRGSNLTVPLVSALFISIAVVHFLAAITNVVPVYIVSAIAKTICALVCLTGTPFVLHNLAAAYEDVAEERRRLERLEKGLSCGNTSRNLQFDSRPGSTEDAPRDFETTIQPSTSPIRL